MNGICLRFSAIEGMMQQNPSDFTSVTLEELVWQKSFRDWVMHPTPEREQYWQGWLANHADQATTLSQAREVVLALKVKNRPITDADIQACIELTRQYLDLPQSAVVKPLPSSRGWVGTNRFAIAAAVSLLLLVGAGLFWQQRPAAVTVTNAPVSKKISELLTAKGTTVRLDDGSLIQLKAGSELRYPARFTAATRDVYLTGEATFSVVRRADQPFLVYANGSVTRVLGTQFTVNAPTGGGRVIVKVLSGKVSVFAESEWKRAQEQTSYQPQSVIVTPNQQVIFERDRERLSKSLVDQPVVINTPVKENRFNFVNTPVPVALKILEQAYNIPIVFDQQLMQHCQVTAPLGDEPLFDKLSIICETIGARFEVVETQIIISGKGCESP